MKFYKKSMAVGFSFESIASELVAAPSNIMNEQASYQQNKDHITYLYASQDKPIQYSNKLLINKLRPAPNFS